MKKGSWKLDLELPAPALDGQPKVFITNDLRMISPTKIRCGE